MRTTSRRASFVPGDLVWCYRYAGSHNERFLGLVINVHDHAKQYDVYLFRHRRVELNVAYGMTLVYNIENNQ